MCPISVCSFFHWSCHVVSLIMYMLLLFVLADESHYHLLGNEGWMSCEVKLATLCLKNIGGSGEEMDPLQ